MIQSSTFLRNVILARLVSPADFGIAAVFGITIQMIEMLSNVASEVLLVQAEDGDDERLQGSAQLIRALRGTGNGLVILVLAGPVAQLFGVPQATWAFRCLASVPFLRGFYHLDMHRLQRHLRFAPSVIADGGGSWLATFAAVPLGFWLHDYSVMLFALIIQMGMGTIVSHLLAERRYRWDRDKGYWMRIVKFGWPLMINGIFMFGIFEGDRIVIGSAKRLFPHSQFTLTDLGVYSVAFGLTMAPTMFIANICSPLFLPLLSRVQGTRDQFERRYVACALAVSLCAALMSIVFITAGGLLVRILYGANYIAAGTIMVWLSTMWALRMIRVAPTLAAMALGDTQNTMISNAARSLALIGMGIAAASGAGLLWIAVSGVAGETLALAASVWRLRRQNGLSPILCGKPLAVAVAGIALSARFAWAPEASVVITILSCLGCMAVVTAGMLIIFPTLREDATSVFFPARAAARS